MKKAVAKKIIAAVVAVVITVGIVLTIFGDKMLYPTYEKTESTEFAQNLGAGEEKRAVKTPTSRKAVFL